MIFVEVFKKAEFDPKIDINSLLPVYFLPIVKKKAEDSENKLEVFGLLQIVLKNRRNSELDCDEPIEVLSNKFSECIKAAFQILFYNKV